jgi:hypothetical protein
MKTLMPPRRWISVGAGRRSVILTAAVAALLLGPSIGAREKARANDSSLYLAAKDSVVVEQGTVLRLWGVFVEDFDARTRRSEVLIERILSVGSSAIGAVENTVRGTSNVLFGRERGVPTMDPTSIDPTPIIGGPADPIPPVHGPEGASSSAENLDALVARVQRLNSARVLPAPVLDRAPDRMLVDYENGADSYPQSVEAAEPVFGARHLLARLMVDDTVLSTPTGRLVLASSPGEVVSAALDSGLIDRLTDGSLAGGMEAEFGGCAYAVTTWDEGVGDGSPLVGVRSDRPRRLPDGSIFMSKPSQRLLMIRTTHSCEDRVVLTTKAFGHLIRDPNASGLVQASQAGRVGPGENGLPYVGMRVRAGQELGVLTPAIDNPERGRLEQELAEIRSKIVQLELKLARTRDFLWIPFRLGRMLSIRLELDGLRNQRDAIIAGLDDDEHLLASADGVISMAKITAGQLVEAHDMLWEIVDPDKLWVEVLMYDGVVASDVDRAWARTSDGESLPVAFIGRGLMLENQGILLQFRVDDPPSSLSVGKPVTVFIESDTSTRGVILPQSAVVRDSSAQDMVWEHVSAERFVPHPVRVRPINGHQVVVLSGIGPDLRIVSNGAGLLNHVR